MLVRCNVCSQCEPSLETIVEPVDTGRRIQLPDDHLNGFAEGKYEVEYTCKECGHYEKFIGDLRNPYVKNLSLVAERLLTAKFREDMSLDHHPIEGWGIWDKDREGNWRFLSANDCMV